MCTRVMKREKNNTITNLQNPEFWLVDYSIKRFLLVEVNHVCSYFD